MFMFLKVIQTLNKILLRDKEASYFNLNEFQNLFKLEKRYPFILDYINLFLNIFYWDKLVKEMEGVKKKRLTFSLIKNIKIIKNEEVEIFKVICNSVN